MSAQNQPFQPPQPYIPMAKRRRGWVLPVIIIGVVLLLISIPFFVFIGVVSSVSNIESKPTEITKNTVLVMDLSSFPEVPDSNPFAVFSGESNRNTVFDIVGAIKAAKDDKKIKGIYIKQGMSSFGFGKANEITNALLDFKTSGKFIYAYLPWASENSFYIASAADSIFAPSMGFFEMNGFGVSGLFFKNFFNKIGIDFYVEHFEDYKSAGESFSRANFSDSSKVQLRILIQQRFDELVNQISANRKIDRAKLVDAINRGQYTTDSLMALGLIDAIATPQDFEDKVYFKVFGKYPTDGDKDDEKKSKDVNYVDLSSYAGTDYPANGKLYDDDTKIAIIQAAGEITSDSQGINPAGNNEGITDGKMIKYLEEARKDKDVKAIIIRIDSPGGSALASDNIWQEIMKVRKEKPVYASMSDVAASGGYYISMACDTIVAYPNTITGSIGVISMIPNVSGLTGKLGFTSDTINVGNHAQFLNGMYPYNDYDKAKFREAMKTIYWDFVGKAAKNRKKTFEELRAVAKGRVWTGSDALKLGLVDQLGNFQTAIDLAKKRIGVPLDKKVLVELYPKPEDQFEEFLNFIKDIGKMKSSDISGMLERLGYTSAEYSSLNAVWSSLPQGIQNQIKYNLKLMQISKKENIMMVLPFYM
jgi:protease-4